MRYRTSKAVTGLQLDPSCATGDEPHRLKMVQCIAVATENTRKQLRGDSTWGLSIPQPIRGFAPLSERFRQPTTLLADMLPWPALLTMEDCAGDAARLAGCTRNEILSCALSICPYAHMVVLLNYLGHVDGIAAAAKALSPVIQGLKGKEARIQKGASAGGKKSAERRKKQSKVPETAKLLADFQRLIDAGRDAKDIAGILADRYGVHSSTVRRKLREAK